MLLVISRKFRVKNGKLFLKGIKVTILSYTNKIFENHDFLNDFWHFWSTKAIKNQEPRSETQRWAWRAFFGTPYPVYHPQALNDYCVHWKKKSYFLEYSFVSNLICGHPWRLIFMVLLGVILLWRSNTAFRIMSSETNWFQNEPKTKFLMLNMILIYERDWQKRQHIKF